jgi:surfeit locus 1 family protein
MFSPKSWIVPGALLLLAAGFVWLGRWQLDRAQVNRALEARFAEAANMPVLERAVPDEAVDEHRYRRIRLEGRFEPGRQVLLDNMTRNGLAGYEVLTPFSVKGSDRLVMVNRGWLASAPDRAELPDVALLDGARAIRGRIDRLPRAALSLGQDAASETGPVIVMSFPDFEEIEAALGRKLAHFQLLLDADEEDGFLRDWGPRTGLADRNIAYAVQWFGLSLVAFAIGVGSVVRRGRNPS